MLEVHEYEQYCRSDTGHVCQSTSESTASDRNTCQCSSDGAMTCQAFQHMLPMLCNDMTSCHNGHVLSFLSGHAQPQLARDVLNELVPNAQSPDRVSL